MGRVNIKGLRGLSTQDRSREEQYYLDRIQGWKDFTEDTKDAFYRNDNFRRTMIDNNLNTN